MGLEAQDIVGLKKTKKLVEKFEEEVEELRNHLFYFIKNLNETSVRGSNFYIMVLANLTDIVQSLEYVSRKGHKHFDNNHKHLSTSQLLDLREIQGKLTGLIHDAEQAFKNKNFADLMLCLKKKDTILDLISDKVNAQISRTRQEEQSPKNTTLYFNILIETKDLVNGVFKLIHEYHEGAGQDE